MKNSRDKNQLTTSAYRLNLATFSVTALLLFGLLISPEIHAKADMCGVDNGMPGAGCTVDSFCDLDPPSQVPGPTSGGGCGVPGFTNPPSNFFEYFIDGDSRTVTLCDENGNLDPTAGPRGDGESGSRFKMVSDVESEFFNSDSVGSPYASLVGSSDTGVYPDIHTFEQLVPGDRFYIGYTAEHPHEQFTNLFRLSTDTLPPGTLVRLGIRNGNATAANQPVMSDPNDFSIGASGVSVATQDAACQSITYSTTPADISGVDTSLFTWANFVLGDGPFNFTLKAETGVAATDFIAVMELPQGCGTDPLAGPQYGPNAPQLFFDLIDNNGAQDGAVDSTLAEGEGEIVFGFTVDPKAGYTADATGCSVENPTYDDGPFSGFTDPSSIGDLVWNDLNLDGIKDPTESGIGNVTIDLYRDLDSNGVVSPGDTLAATEITAADGSYAFEQLAAGDYIVVVTDTSNALNGFFSTTNNTPLPVTLASAQDFTAADFGYSQSVDLSMLKTAAPATVVPGDTITYSLTVTNNSVGAATGVQVTDTLDSGVTYVSATVEAPATGTCSFSSPTVTCDITSAIAGGGGTAEVTIDVTVN